MALRVPAVQVQDEALAVRLWRVIVADTACTTGRTAAGAAAAVAACRRCRSRARPRGGGSSCTTPRCRLRPPASARVRGARAADGPDRTGSPRPARRRGRTIRPTARNAGGRSGRAHRARAGARRSATRGRSPRWSHRAAKCAGPAACRRATRPIRRADRSGRRAGAAGASAVIIR